MNKQSLKRFFLIGIIASLVVSAAFGILVLLKGSMDDVDWKVIFTTLVVGVFSITSLATLRNLEESKKSYRTFALISLLISGLAFILYCFLIWIPDDLYWKWETFGKITNTLGILAISSAHASLLLPFREKSRVVSLVVTFTFAFIALVAAMILNIIWTPESYNFEDFNYRLLGVFAILDVLGTIVTPIIGRLTKTNLNQNTQT